MLLKVVLLFNEFFRISVKNRLKQFEIVCSSSKAFMTLLSINTHFISFNEFISVPVCNLLN